ncbi:MAG: VWA domain-containing protein [Acidimicrobiia bacterium]|nr:VWA domain-containing protein [Acidimicrobiia bacterium]
MIDTLASFVSELRAVGIPVSTAEAIDAAAALQHVDVGKEASVREALAATMIKVPRYRRAFDTAFDVFFGVGAVEGAEWETSAAGTENAGELAEGIAAALHNDDIAALRRLVGDAVSQLAGFQPGRPVGGRYYLYRVLQRLEGVEELLEDPTDDDRLARAIAADDVAALMERLRMELRREIVRRLVADRGPDPVARTLREALAEDIDLMHATRDELDRIESAIAPLAQKLATRLAQRKRRGGHGRLDLRRTIRASLAHGGALVAPQFRAPRRTKPEIVLLCDVSGSMATFARFTMQFTYAVASQFSRVRTFAFVDEIDDVTRFFGPDHGFAAGLARMTREARLVGRDGHSDYGVVWQRFVERHADVVTPQTTLIVTGDARNNYRDTRTDLFADVANRARAAFWLNPEARRFWDTGDSVMALYARECTAVFEVRTLRQLERFVEQVALWTQKAPLRSLN